LVEHDSLVEHNSLVEHYSLFGHDSLAVEAILDVKYQLHVAVGCEQGGLGSQAELGIQAVRDKV